MGEGAGSSARHRAADEDAPAGAAFPQVAPDEAPNGCGSHREPHADRTTDRMRSAVEGTRIAVILLGTSLGSSYLGAISTAFRWIAVACLVAGLAFAITAWPPQRG